MQHSFCAYTVSEKTGINAALLRHEKPLSAVLPNFLKWIATTTQEVTEQVGTLHYPGIHVCTFILFLVS